MSSSALKVSLCVWLPLLLAGCHVQGQWVQRRIDHAFSRTSFVSWNLRSAVGKPQEAGCSRAFAVASLSNRELDKLMECKPAPELHELEGCWKGINKGFGPALAGMTQDVKVFVDDGSCVRGYNQLVNQVSISDLACKGWQAKIDPKTCKPKTIGKFTAVTSGCDAEKLALDYTIANNPWYDPSRVLVDELVLVEPNVILGRANAKLGSLKIPVAYFVLFR